jgi:hypothetical protein
MMDTEELKSAMRGATTGLRPRPSLTQDVLRGGRRRQVRRRITATAMAVVTSVVAVTVSVAGWQSQSERLDQATDPRLTEPTRGELAGDEVFIADVIQAWNRSLPDKLGGDPPDPVTAPPHVFWAGETPAGRAAVVLQPWPDTPIQPATTTGLVGRRPSTGSLEVLTYGFGEPSRSRGFAYRLGAGGHTVLANIDEQPLSVSAGVSYDLAGKAKRDWRDMTRGDGVFLAELPEGTGPADARLGIPVPGGGFLPENTIAPQYADPDTVSAGSEESVGLDWFADDGRPSMMTVGPPAEHGNDRAWTAQRFREGLASSGLLDPASPVVPSDSPWYVTFGGQQPVIVSEYGPLHSGRPRLYAVQLDENDKFLRAMPSGPIDVAAELPVLASLAGHGWIAAAKGATLSYRFAAGAPWQGTQSDAVPVPQGATHIQVERPGRAPAIVDVK